MRKTLEQRIANLEKVIMEFWTGTERSAKKTSRTVKRKAKAARKSVAKKIKSRKVRRRA